YAPIFSIAITIIIRLNNPPHNILILLSFLSKKAEQKHIKKTPNINPENILVISIIELYLI
ncbi:MAG: hypothetical protein ACKVG7_08475, partial [Flavobacteriales bacterium]